MTPPAWSRDTPSLVLVLYTLLAALTVAPASPQTATPTPSGDTADSHEVVAQGVVVRYRAIPWDASRLAVLTHPSPAGRGVQAFALGELQLDAAMLLDGRRLEAGHYGIFCHGQLAPNEAPVLRLVPFNGPTLLAGQMADLARVETSSRPPIRFDLAAGTAPALRIGLTPTKRGVTLTVEYGNRRAVAVLRR
jgi:hypothetical protein